MNQSPFSNITANPLTTIVTQSPVAPDTQQLAWTIAQAADDRKGADIILLNVADVSYLSDYFVIITGFSPTQVKAIADAIEEKVAQVCHKHPLRVEGKSESSWILVDYGDVIVHIFLPQEREFYGLEAFWGHAQTLQFSQLQSTQSQ